MLAFIANAPASAQASTPTSSQPAAPDGYAWYTAKNGVGNFLVPKAWFAKEEIQGDTHALFITQGVIPDGGQFAVGLTVNQFRNFSNVQTIKPSDFAKQYASALSRKGEVLVSTVVKGNKTDLNIVRVRDVHDGKTTIIHYITIGMDAEDRFYVLIFEAPQEEFDRAFTLAKPMLNLFALGE